MSCTTPVNWMRNREKLKRLFSQPGGEACHAIWMTHPAPVRPELGDYTIAKEKDFQSWVDFVVKDYESQVRWHNLMNDDSVPYVRLVMGTHVFGSAFGCHAEHFAGSNPAAMPLVHSAEEAEKLKVPGLEHVIFERIFRMVEEVRRRVGPSVPISVPDVQSPFDIAAMIWAKEDLFMAVYDTPEVVKGLVEKCYELVVKFLDVYLERVGEANMAHCPVIWAPRELGIWLSEDEVGALSPDAFEEFCLPWLERLSKRFGGISMHCCAAADHQYESFTKIPQLRALNRVYQGPGPNPAIDAFAGRTTLIHAWSDENFVNQMIDYAKAKAANGGPACRFFFQMDPCPQDEGMRMLERLRTRLEG